MSAQPDLFRRWSQREDWLADGEWLAHCWQADQAWQQALLDTGLSQVEGHCALCERPTRFSFQRPREPGGCPNWREELSCRHCRLINRSRAALALFRELGTGRPPASLYLTERLTRVYHWLRQRHPECVGSEYAGPGRRAGSSSWQRFRRVRHEDVTALSFARASFDAVLSFEVLEHLPNHLPALAEFARVLRPGGLLLLTAPFDPQLERSRQRARLHPDGRIEHLFEPIYHRDPLRRQGVLCWQDFGWDLLDALRSGGFEQVALVAAWDPLHGHAGGPQWMVSATRE